jgi:hypothetical protein
LTRPAKVERMQASSRSIANGHGNSCAAVPVALW